MFSLRCTKKLLERMRVEPVAEPPAPTTVLGDWYANLVRVGRQQVILCVSEKALLPVVLPAVDSKHAPQHLPETLFYILSRLEIPRDLIDRELREMRDSAVTRTANRRVLGTMTDFAFALTFRREDESLMDVALSLAHTPCSPLFKSGLTFPDNATKAAFKASLH